MGDKNPYRDGGNPDKPPQKPPASPGSPSSVSSGPSQAQLQAEENARAAFRELIRRWGLAPSKNLLNLIEKAVQSGWNSTLFLDRVRHTPEYAEKYQGIRWREGMTEGTYLATFNQYKNIAKTAGVEFNRGDFAKVLKRGVSTQEFSDRVSAIKAIDRWGPMWQYFSETLAARGLASPRGVSKKDLADFVMRLGPKAWEKVYDETFITAGLERVAGLQVGKEGNPGAPSDYTITRGDLLNIVKQVESLSMGSFDPAKLDYAKIGTELRKFDTKYLADYGVTTKDILELELGGPRAADIAVKAQRILDTQNAAVAPRATPNNNALGQRSQQVSQGLPQSL